MNNVAERQKTEINDIVQTPLWLAGRMLSLAFGHTVHHRPFRSQVRLLEPAFGDGGILNAIGAIPYDSCYITGYEIRARGECRAVERSLNYWYKLHYGTNFLEQFQPKHADRMTVCVMNPPFAENGASKFIQQILANWLIPDGILVSVVPMYFLNNSERRKLWIEKHLKAVYILPKDTFAPIVPVFHTAVVVMSPTRSDNPATFRYWS